MTGGSDRQGDVLPYKAQKQGATNRENDMKLISNLELQVRNETELSAMFCIVSKGLTRTERNSPERRNALASLENISRARAQRMLMRPTL